MVNIIVSQEISIKIINLQSHQKDVQSIFEASSEFILLTEGKQPSKDAAKDFFSDVPFNKTIKDKECLGVFNGDNHLIGIIDLIHDYPENNICFVGLFLILPRHRSNRVGQFVFEKCEEHIKNNGFNEIRLAVIQENTKGYNFWKKIGYVDLMKKPYKVADKATEIIVMAKQLN